VALVLVLAGAGGLSLGTWLGQQQAAPEVAGSTAASARPTIVVPAASPSASPARSPVAVASPAPDRQYVVVTGDTLRTIAQQQYGDAALWQLVYEANRDVIGNNPDALQTGMRLRIPPR
jgi:nucleoid-associated protein YgaU